MTRQYARPVALEMNLLSIVASVEPMMSPILNMVASMSFLFSLQACVGKTRCLQDSGGAKLDFIKAPSVLMAVLLLAMICAPVSFAVRLSLIHI